MIELKNVERSYKTGHTETWVLRQVRLTINEGEFVTVMGPSGAGKRRHSALPSWSRLRNRPLPWYRRVARSSCRLL